MPSHHLLPIDPLLVTSMSLNIGADQSVNLKLDMINASLIGLTDVQVLSARFVDTSYRLCMSYGVFSELCCDREPTAFIKHVVLL